MAEATDRCGALGRLSEKAPPGFVCKKRPGHRGKHADGQVRWSAHPVWDELEQAAAEHRTTPPEYQPVVTDGRQAVSDA